MSDFYPDGYVPLQQAVYIAAKFWFPEKVASHETAVADNPTLRVLSHSYPQLPEDFRQAFEETAGPTVRRLRNRARRKARFNRAEQARQRKMRARGMRRRANSYRCPILGCPSMSHR